MSMHLVGPELSLRGKKRGKHKFRNAEEARKHRELQQSWDQLKNKWGAAQAAVKKNSVSGVYTTPTNTRLNNVLPSIDTGVRGPVTVKKTQQYTGTKLIGIGTLHKSNAIPIFSEEEAVDIAKMRR